VDSIDNFPDDLSSVGSDSSSRHDLVDDDDDDGIGFGFSSASETINGTKADVIRSSSSYVSSIIIIQALI
jgi:hypothetical protein